MVREPDLRSSPVENDMDPDIFDNKQIFVLNTLY